MQNVTIGVRTMQGGNRVHVLHFNLIITPQTCSSSPYTTVSYCALHAELHINRAGQYYRTTSQRIISIIPVYIQISYIAYTLDVSQGFMISCDMGYSFFLHYITFKLACCPINHLQKHLFLEYRKEIMQTLKIHLLRFRLCYHALL